MAKKIVTPVNVEREMLDDFCDQLPEPIIAKPVVKTIRGRGLSLALKYPGKLVHVVENGEPCFFSSVDMVVYALDGMPNIDVSELIPKTAYWQYAYPA